MPLCSWALILMPFAGAARRWTISNTSWTWCLSIERSTAHCLKHTIAAPIERSIDRCTKDSVECSIKRSIERPAGVAAALRQCGKGLRDRRRFADVQKSIDHPIECFIGRSVERSIDHSRQCG